MKNIFVFLMMLLVALPSFARPRPRFPHPGRLPGRTYPMPVPRRTCQVVMVDRYNRVMNRYWGHRSNYGQCSKALRECYQDVRYYGGFGARCAQVRY